MTKQRLKFEVDASILLQIGPKIKSILASFNIGHLLLLSLALHLFIISFPQDGFIFDEAHYVPAAIKTLNLEPANAEHTPLAKIIIALSIAVFGNYWFAWRFPIVIMSIVSLYIFYLLSRRFMTDHYALYATAFLSFNIIYFVHGSIFVLDMPAILFGLLGIHLYFSQRYSYSALSFGLSFLMKELGLFFLGTMLIYHLLTHFKVPNLNQIKKVAGFLLVILLVSGGGLWIYDFVFKPTTGASVFTNAQLTLVKDTNGTVLTTITTLNNITSFAYITNPVEHLKFSWNYFSGLSPNIITSDTDYRPPWSWILPIGNIFNSPKYLSVTVSYGDVSKIILNWVSQISPTVDYLYIPILLTAVHQAFKGKNKKEGILLSSWLSISYIPWLILGLFVQRMTFNYYYIYTIPALALGIPLFWSKIIKNEKTRNIILFTHLSLTFLFFLYFFPVVLIR